MLIASPTPSLPLSALTRGRRGVCPTIPRHPMRHIIWPRHRSAAAAALAAAHTSTRRLLPSPLLPSPLSRASPAPRPDRSLPLLSPPPLAQTRSRPRQPVPLFATPILQFQQTRRLHTHVLPGTPPSVEDMETVNTTARLAAVRSLMKENGVDIYGISPISPTAPDTPRSPHNG